MCAFSFRAGSRYKSIMLIYDLFGNSQPDTRAFIFVLGIQTLEQSKNTGNIFFIETYAIIGDGEQTVGATRVLRTVE